MFYRVIRLSSILVRADHVICIFLEVLILDASAIWTSWTPFFPNTMVVGLPLTPAFSTARSNEQMNYQIQAWRDRCQAEGMPSEISRSEDLNCWITSTLYSCADQWSIWSQWESNFYLHCWHFQLGLRRLGSCHLFSIFRQQLQAIDPISIQSISFTWW